MSRFKRGEFVKSSWTVEPDDFANSSGWCQFCAARGRARVRNTHRVWAPYTQHIDGVAEPSTGHVVMAHACHWHALAIAQRGSL